MILNKKLKHKIVRAASMVASVLDRVSGGLGRATDAVYNTKGAAK